MFSNTGPLISLDKLNGGHDFIRLLYDRILIPKTVLEELAMGQYSPAESYLEHYAITDLIEVKTVVASADIPESSRLDRGEIQTITLALRMSFPLLIEETTGRRSARQLGLLISGIAGQIIRAFRQGLISDSAALAFLQQLLRAGRLSRRMYQELAEVVAPAPSG